MSGTPTGTAELARRWIRHNLARSRLDAVVSAAAGVAVAYVLYRMARFVLVTGRWEIIRVNLKLLLVGRYPVVHLPRVAVVVVVAAALAGLVAGIVHRRQVAAGTSPVAGLGGGDHARQVAGRLWPLLLGMALLLVLSRSAGPFLCAAAAAAAAAAGRLAGARVPKRLHAPLVVVVVLSPFALVAYLADGAGWDDWGGLLLNVFIAVVSIVLCFPVGVIAALGRRSSLPVIRLLSTLYIELFRGAPLFVLLLMANVALRFFIPDTLAPSDAVRAMVVFTLFTGAYLAEIVRGGLQSLPPGQEEAARALGLSPLTTTARVVLPQALRNVIPAQVGQLISLFKDTTLAGVALGILDLAQGIEAANAQPGFAGQQLLPETYAFVGLLFWVGSYTMSRESQRIEARLGVGER